MCDLLPYVKHCVNTSMPYEANACDACYMPIRSISCFTQWNVILNSLEPQASEVLAYQTNYVLVSVIQQLHWTRPVAVIMDFSICSGSRTGPVHLESSRTNRRPWRIGLPFVLWWAAIGLHGGGLGGTQTKLFSRWGSYTTVLTVRRGGQPCSPVAEVCIYDKYKPPAWRLKENAHTNCHSLLPERQHTVYTVFFILLGDVICAENQKAHGNLPVGPESFCAIPSTRKAHNSTL